MSSGWNYKIALDKGQTIIPSMIGVKGVLEDKTEFVFGYEALALTGENYQDEDVTVFYDIKRWISDADRKQSVTLKTDINTRSTEKKC